MAKLSGAVLRETQNNGALASSWLNAERILTPRVTPVRKKPWSLSFSVTWSDCVVLILVYADVTFSND